MAHKGKYWEQVKYRDWWINSQPNRFPPKVWKVTSVVAGGSTPVAWTNFLTNSEEATDDHTLSVYCWEVKGPVGASPDVWIEMQTERTAPPGPLNDRVRLRLHVDASVGPWLSVTYALPTNLEMILPVGSIICFVGSTPYTLQSLVLRSKGW